MLEIIVGTREQTMNRAIVEAVDNFTRHTDENRYGIEGWKTNSGYMLSKLHTYDIRAIELIKELSSKL